MILKSIMQNFITQQQEWVHEITELLSTCSKCPHFAIPWHTLSADIATDQQQTSSVNNVLLQIFPDGYQTMPN